MALPPTPAEIKAAVETTLSDDTIQTIIDAIDQEVIQYGGPHDPSGVIELLEGGRTEVAVSRQIADASTVIVREDIDEIDVDSETLVKGTDYRVWPDQGRIELISTLTSGAWHNRHGHVGSLVGSRGHAGRLAFDTVVEVTYDAVDDREIREQVEIALVRLEISNTGFKSENIAGEYSYSRFSGSNVEEIDAQFQRLRQFGIVGFGP